MDQPVSDSIIMGIDMALVAILLSSFIFIASNFSSLNSAMDSQETIRTSLEEYREQNGYDNTKVYSSDIVSAILKSKGTMTISVSNGTNTYVWSDSSAASPYTASQISALLDNNVLYNSKLVFGGNNEVAGYDFEVVP